MKNLKKIKSFISGGIAAIMMMLLSNPVFASGITNDSNNSNVLDAGASITTVLAIGFTVVFVAFVVILIIWQRHKNR